MPEFCSKCKEKLLYIHPDLEYTRHKIDGKNVCDDCWFNALGDLVEKYPKDN
jgi:hypothetical protein